MLCRLPSPWDAMGMKHICSKSSLYTGFELLPGARSLLAETAGIKQNQTENAKPSQFSRVFLEVPGGLPRDKGIQQALIEAKRSSKKPGNMPFPGSFFTQYY